MQFEEGDADVEIWRAGGELIPGEEFETGKRDGFGFGKVVPQLVKTAEMPLDIGDALIFVRRKRMAEAERFFQGYARGFQVLGGDGFLGVRDEIANLLAGEAGVCGADGAGEE